MNCYPFLIIGLIGSGAVVECQSPFEPTLLFSVGNFLIVLGFFIWGFYWGKNEVIE